MPRVINRRRGHEAARPGAIYVGRPTKWGNPFSISKHHTRAQVIAMYERWLLDNPALLADLHELRGKDLVCYCAPLPCHADVLLRLANS